MANAGWGGWARTYAEAISTPASGPVAYLLHKGTAPCRLLKQRRGSLLPAQQRQKEKKGTRNPLVYASADGWSSTDFSQALTAASLFSVILSQTSLATFWTPSAQTEVDSTYSGGTRIPIRLH